MKQFDVEKAVHICNEMIMLQDGRQAEASIVKTVLQAGIVEPEEKVTYEDVLLACPVERKDTIEIDRAVAEAWLRCKDNDMIVKGELVKEIKQALNKG